MASVGANERKALIDMEQAMHRGETNLTPYREALKAGIMADMQARNATGTPVPDDSVARQALARENELLALRGDPRAKNDLLASISGKNERQALSDMVLAMERGERNLDPYRKNLREAIARDSSIEAVSWDASSSQTGSASQAIPQDTATAALPNPLSEVSPERMRAIQGLAQDERSVGNLRNLAQDMAFIEQSMSLNQEDFAKAIKDHDWQVDSRKMQSYASGIYDHKDSKDYVEDRTRELLHDTYLSSVATRDTAQKLATTMAEGVERGPQNKDMSNALNELSDQVTEVQAQERTKRS